MKKDEKHVKFKQLAQKRTFNVLKSLKVLGNCSNRSAYYYTEEDIKKIFKVLEKELRDTKAKFHFPRSKPNDFKL